MSLSSFAFVLGVIQLGSLSLTVTVLKGKAVAVRLHKILSSVSAAVSTSLISRMCVKSMSCKESLNCRLFL